MTNYRTTITTKKKSFLIFATVTLALAACGEDAGGTGVDGSGGYVTVITEPPPEVLSGEAFTVEVGITTEDGESTALEGL